MRDYSNLSHEELREKLKSGELKKERVHISVYEDLLYRESKLRKPDVDISILQSCIEELRQHKKYKEFKNQEDTLIFSEVMLSRLEQERSPHKEKFALRKLRKRRLVMVATIATLALALVGCAAIFDFFGVMLKLPLSTTTELDGRAMIRTEDERFYTSLSNLIAIEQLNFFYPAILPEGYAFTNFDVINTGTHLNVLLYATEPYIKFRVMVGANVHIDSYNGEINDVKYRVFEYEGMHQADWNIGENYYFVIVNDSGIIPEIINSLKES